MFSRFVLLPLLIKGEPKKKQRNPIPASRSRNGRDQAILPAREIFIFGHARSGTTLLMRLVRLHPEVHCDYQAHLTFSRRRPLLKCLLIQRKSKNG